MVEILHLRRQRGRRGHVVFYVALSAQSWPYSTVVESVISLLPGILIVVVAAGSSYLVTKHFRAEATKN